MHWLCSFSAQAVISAILRSSESLQDHWGRDMLLGNRFPHSIYTKRSVFHYLKALSLFRYPSPSQRRTHIHTLTRFDPCGMAYCSLYNNFRTQFELLIGFSSLIKRNKGWNNLLALCYKLNLLHFSKSNRGHSCNPHSRSLPSCLLVSPPCSSSSASPCTLHQVWTHI